MSSYTSRFMWAVVSVSLFAAAGFADSGSKPDAMHGDSADEIIEEQDDEQTLLSKEKKLKSIMDRQKIKASAPSRSSYGERDIEYKERARRKEIEDEKADRQWIYE